MRESEARGIRSTRRASATPRGSPTSCNWGNPVAASVQRAKISDSIQLANITAGGGNNPAPLMARNQVLLKLYTGSCVTGGTEVASYPLTLNFGNAVNGLQTASTDFSVDFVVSSDQTFFWAIQWDGDTFNNGITLLQSCTLPSGGKGPAESVTIDFTPNQ
jgi:hypothetical protein